MPRRRTVTRTREQVATLFRNAIEELEPRTLLHTLTGSGVFEYRDGTNQIVRVRYHNIQAELVFARVDMNTNNVVLTEPTPAFVQDEDGKDLFHIYVAQAGADAFLSIAEVPAITANTRPMQPFSGSVPLTIRGLRGAGFQGVTTDGGSGAVYLGAKTKDTPANIANEVNRPILTDQFFGMGILGPRPNGRLTAGIFTEAGTNFDKFFFGGAISGEVHFGGSVDTFYAGAVLTGDTRGEIGAGSISIPQNFTVAGDVRDFIVMGSIGTHADAAGGEPVYESGFDMHVAGTIGRVQTYGSIIGDIRAQNDPAAVQLRSSQREIENKVLPGNRGSATHFEGTDNRDLVDNNPFDAIDPREENTPRLGDSQAEFNNDTFDTAQFLGSFNSPRFGAGSIVLNGRLQNNNQINDNQDFFAVPLMAGQSIQVRLLSPAPGFFVPPEGFLIEDIPVGFLNIFDPDGRLVGSDVNNVDLQETANKLIQFTATTPGVYRFEVSAIIGGTEFIGDFDYQLQVQKAGVMSIGNIVASGDIFGEHFDQHQFVSVNGDLGSIFAGGGLANAGFAGIFADGGNLRAVDAANIGFAINTNRWAPNFEVFGGDVGVIRARTESAYIFDLTIHDNRFGVGGSAQLIEAPNGGLLMNVNADKRLGVIRATHMETFIASTINVNADLKGADGVIDLIDVSGNFGANGPGGPQITTGPGGNVRYIHVGGLTFQDVFFSRGGPDLVNYAPGETVNFVDDSGTNMILEPNPSRAFDPVTGLPLPVGSLSVVRYGIREKGGSVLVNLASTQGVRVVAGGQRGTRGTAEIGEINANGLGTLIVDDPGNLTSTSADDALELASTGDDLEVILVGEPVIDVYEIVGGNFTEIMNETAGEIVNVNAQSIGDIEAATLGLAKSSTGMQVGGVTFLDTTPTQVDAVADAGPFSNQRIGIQVAGDIISARARQGLGNFIVSGSIQELSANVDRVNTLGVHEGINAPIMTRTGGVALGGGGEIRFVQIGEGVLPSGTGSVSFSGIFSHSRIGRIVNQGEGSDIRGDIHSKGENLPTFQRRLNNGTLEIVPLAPIGVIDLDDGAILGADIMVTTRFQNAWEQNSGAVVAPSFGNLADNPVFEIEFISLEGKGGIMTTNIFARDIGPVEVKGGFGIFNTTFGSLAQGTFNSVTADGFGIRGVAFEGGSDLANLNARGNGTRLSANDFTSSVRFSETQRFDPFSGYVLSELNDLHLYLGTSAAAPVRLTGDRSRSGVIDDIDARGNGNLGTVNAYQIKSSILSYAAGTDEIIVRDYIDTMLLTTGGLDHLHTRNDVHWADIRIAGRVGSVNIGGTWRGTSTLAAEGPNGQIGRFSTGRALYGTVISSNNLNELIVATDIGAVGSFNEDGERLSAGVDVAGDIQSLRVGGSILDGATVWVGDLVSLLAVDGDIQEEARVDIRRLGTLRMGGELFGDLIVRSEQ